MTGIITTGDGQRWSLGPLIEWELLRTDGHSCDSFSVRFPLEDGETAPLAKAAAFTACDGETVVFTGIVDSMTAALDRRGRTAVLEGRSLLGRLLDNEAGATEFQLAALEDVLRAFVRPFGITKIDAPAMAPVPRFRVDAGTSCWAALSGWCLHSGGVTPRLTADGTLTLRPCAARWSIGAGLPVTEAVWTRTRYGVASEIVAADGSRVKNDAFTALGGMARRYAPRQTGYLRAGYRTARQRSEASAETFDTVRLTAPGQFLAEPGAQVALTLEKLGLEGNFTAREVCTRGGPAGETCRLTLVRGV